MTSRAVKACYALSGLTGVFECSKAQDMPRWRGHGIGEPTRHTSKQPAMGGRFLRPMADAKCITRSSSSSLIRAAPFLLPIS